MNIYFGIKYHSNLQNKKHIDFVLDTLESLGHKLSFIQRDLEQWGKKQVSAQTLMQKTFEHINHSDLVLIDLSEKGVGLGIEAGYAHAKQKPIIVIAKKGSDLSATLKGISSSVHFYGTKKDLRNIVQQLSLEAVKLAL